jgi:hypothetical protein
MSYTCPVCKGSTQTPFVPPPGMTPLSKTQNCLRCAATGKVDFLRDDEDEVPAADVLLRERGGPLS